MSASAQAVVKAPAENSGKRPKRAAIAPDNLHARISHALPGFCYVFSLETGEMIFGSRSLTAELGHHAECTDREPIWAFALEQDRPHVVCSRSALHEAADTDVVEFEVRIRRGDARTSWVRCRERVFERDDFGRPILVLGIGHDVTSFKEAQRLYQRQVVQLQRIQEHLQSKRLELEKANRELAHVNRTLEVLSLTDNLTELHNRRALGAFLNPLLNLAKRNGSPLTLLMIDIDNFKNYNDTFGHLAGDEALAALGDMLKRSTRSSDFVARYGGEEFVVVLPDTDGQGALEVAERIRRRVTEIDGLKRSITVSIGLAELRARADSMEQLISRADALLYEAKHNGKNQIRGSVQAA